MPNLPEDGEIDYLARPKQKAKKSQTKRKGPFQRAVEEAYRLEYGCTTNVAISKVVGKSTGRISQTFKDSGSIELETLDWVLAPLKSVTNKQNIVLAWTYSRYGFTDRVEVDDEMAGRSITEETMNSIRTLYRANQFTRAVRLANRVLELSTNQQYRYLALDFAVNSCLAIDLPGIAIQFAYDMAEEAMKLGHFYRVALAHYDRARAVNQIPTSSFDDVMKALDQAEDWISKASNQPEAVKASRRISIRTVAFMRVNAEIAHMERGTIPYETNRVESLISGVKSQISETASTLNKGGLELVLARLFALKGDHFSALELLDSGFEHRAGIADFNAHSAALIRCRIDKLSEPLDTCIDYIEEVISNPQNRMAWYHRRLFDFELVDLFNRKFEKLAQP